MKLYPEADHRRSQDPLAGSERPFGRTAATSTADHLPACRWTSDPRTRTGDGRDGTLMTGPGVGSGLMT